MNLYEITYLISPELTNEDATELGEKLAESFKSLDSTLYKIEDPKKRNLAYEVRGFNEAYIASVDLDVSSEKVKLIEEELKEEKMVIRHIVISKDELEKEEDPEIKEEEEEEIDDVPDTKDEENDQDNEDDQGKEEEEEEDDDKKVQKKVKLKEIDEKIDEIL